MSIRPAAKDWRLERYLRCYETLAPASVETLAALFADGGRFVDPFNEAHGAADVGRIFEHMFEHCASVRFEIGTFAMSGDTAFVDWQCTLRLKRAAGEHCLTGASRIRFDTEGQVLEHVDFWDAASQVYAKLPVVGVLVRWLARRFRVQ